MSWEYKENDCNKYIVFNRVINDDEADNYILVLTEKEAIDLCIKKEKEEKQSYIKGVHWYQSYKKWTAGKTINGIYNFLGYFETKEEAEEAMIKFNNEIENKIGQN